MKYAKKAEYKKNPEILNTLSQLAIKQIQENQYDLELNGDIVYIGIAHCGKNVKIEWVQKQSQ